MKNILLLGSTGSIGISTLNVLREFKDQFKVFAITANSNINLLYDQILEFQPKFAVVKEKDKANKLKEKIGDVCKILDSEEGLIEVTKNGDY
ncbi:MAG: 1-deoxy-D-xylulose-5-phosphate reductoisomerase, partial [Melioribacteraceae bacterium]|nr:1-deoxy-D-xylulose-5-phosphate reductoisomerase [Melioribacteraceae bacterium]